MQADLTEPTPVWTRDLLWSELDARHERELRYRGIGLAILFSALWTIAPMASYALYQLASFFSYDGSAPVATERAAPAPCAPVPNLAP